MATKTKAEARKETAERPRIPSWASAKIEAHGGENSEVIVELEHVSTPDGGYDRVTIDLDELDKPGDGYQNRHRFTVNAFDVDAIDALVAALTSLRLAQMARGAR